MSHHPTGEGAVLGVLLLLTPAALKAISWLDNVLGKGAVALFCLTTLTVAVALSIALAREGRRIALAKGIGNPTWTFFLLTCLVMVTWWATVWFGIGFLA